MSVIVFSSKRETGAVRRFVYLPSLRNPGLGQDALGLGFASLGFERDRAPPRETC